MSRLSFEIVHLHIVNVLQVKFTQKMKFIDPATVPAIPIYRISDTEGNILDEEQDPGFDQVGYLLCILLVSLRFRGFSFTRCVVFQKAAVQIYRYISQLNTMDVLLYSCQRQGRISFYMTSFGEEVGPGNGYLQSNTFFANS